MILEERGYEAKTFIEDIASPDRTFVENTGIVCVPTLTSTAIWAYPTGNCVNAKGVPAVRAGVLPYHLLDEVSKCADFDYRSRCCLS